MISNHLLQEDAVAVDNRYSPPLAPLVPLLGEDIHVWHIPLDAPGEHWQQLALLSHEEIHRADRFHFARDRRRFVVARTALRQILSGYLNCGPAELRFEYAAHGKPGPSYPVTDVPVTPSMSEDVTILVVVSGRE